MPPGPNATELIESKPWLEGSVSAAMAVRLGAEGEPLTKKKRMPAATRTAAAPTAISPVRRDPSRAGFRVGWRTAAGRSACAAGGSVRPSATTGLTSTVLRKDG